MTQGSGRVHDLSVAIETNFANVDFPTDTLSPTTRASTADTLFSYTFFWDGFTGLAITIGAVATLFFVMQVTGRTQWRHARGALSSSAT